MCYSCKLFNNYTYILLIGFYFWNNILLDYDPEKPKLTDIITHANEFIKDTFDMFIL